MLVGPSKQLKQIIQIKHNIVKNPNWPEANQLAIYKRGRGFELGATEKQMQEVVRAGLEPGTAGLQVRHAGRFPFTKKFRKFRSGCKWNTTFWFVPLEIFWNKRNS